MTVLSLPTHVIGHPRNCMSRDRHSTARYLASLLSDARDCSQLITDRSSGAGTFYGVLKKQSPTACRPSWGLRPVPLRRSWDKELSISSASELRPFGRGPGSHLDHLAFAIRFGVFRLYDYCRSSVKRDSETNRFRRLIWRFSDAASLWDPVYRGRPFRLVGWSSLVRARSPDALVQAVTWLFGLTLMESPTGARPLFRPCRSSRS
jgi:hypothetical protein